MHAMRFYPIPLIKAGRDAMFASQIIFVARCLLPLIEDKTLFKVG